MTRASTRRHEERRRGVEPAGTVNRGGIAGVVFLPATAKGELDMRRTWWIVPVLLLATVSLSLLAGDTAKCSASADDCLKKMVQKFQQTGWLGIEKEKGPDGAVVAAVVPGSPAEAAGFKVGDVIVAINGVEINDANKEALKKATGNAGPGSEMTYIVKRQGAKVTLTAQLAKVPESVMAEWIGEHMLKAHLPATTAEAR
jgi:membrane-associated protease RseP (regulator of RpoE activity)